MKPTLPTWLEDWKNWPLLSLGIAVLWVVVYLVVEVGYGGQLRASRDAHYEAARLTSREPMIEVSDANLPVVRAVNPSFENDALLEFMRERSAEESVKILQAAFENAAQVAQEGLTGHPFRTMGLTAASPAPHTFATHALLHAGPLHLLATLLIWFFVAPAVERMWGRGVLAGSSLVVVLASAGVFALAHSASARPLVGPGALVAALSLALVVRRAQEEIDFTGWLGEQVRFDFAAPGAVVGVLFALYEGSHWLVAQGMLPPGADNSVGVSAHASGAFLGAGLALLFAKLGLERDDTPVRRPRTGKFDLAKIETLRKNGETDEAFALLAEEVERSARNRNVVMAYWEMAIEREEAEDAAPALVRLIEEELRRGAEAVAAGHWKLLHQSAPKVLLEAPKLIRIARAINREHGEDAVAVALEQAMDEKNTGLSPSHAATVARMSFELDPQLAARAARTALKSDKLEDKVREEMELLASALRPDAPMPQEATKKEQPAPSAFFEESDRSAFGQADDLSALASESFPDGAISEAIATGATGRHLAVEIDGRGASDVEWSRMRAVAIVGVHGISDKPIVLIDILIDGSGTPQPLGLLRLRCDRFDTRVLVPKAASSKDALKTVASGFRKQGIEVLADLSSQSGDARPVFESIDAYHDKILRPAGSDLA